MSTLAATTSNNNNPPSLSLPWATFAKLSPRPFLLGHLQSPSSSSPIVRPNRRRVDEFRPPAVHTGSLTHANGSAVVRIGDTAVVCGVRGEILLASDVPGYDGRKKKRDGGDHNHNHRRELSEITRMGLLVPNVELATGCSPAHLPGQPPSALAQTLAVRLLALLECSGLVKDDDLRIWYHPPPSPENDDDEEENGAAVVMAFWTLYIDVLFISLDGNPFDAAWAAVLAALTDVKLPHAYWDVDQERILCEDALFKARRLHLQGAPMPSTFVVFAASLAGEEPIGERRQQQGYWVLADPDAFEEEICDEVVTVTVDGSTGTKPVLIKLEKSGGGVIGREDVKELATIAMARWSEWQNVLRQAGAAK